MSFIVATNVVASQPPDRRPTGTPTSLANGQKNRDYVQVSTLYPSWAARTRYY